MTQKTKHLKLFLTFTILAGFLFYGCQVEEESLRRDNSLQKFKFQQKSYQELMQTTVFNNAISKLINKSQTISNKTEQQSKTIMEDQYGFTILDSPVNVAETSEILSYSILVKSDSQTSEDYFENLVVNVNKLSSVLSAYLVKHKLAPITNPNNPHRSLITAETTIKPITYNNQDLSARIQTTCHTMLVLMCQKPWEDSGEEEPFIYTPPHPVEAECFEDFSYLTVVEVRECIDVYTPDENAPTPIGGSTGPTSPIITSPILPPCTTCPTLSEKDPCETVAPLLSPTKANLKGAIEALQPSASQTAGESGTSLVKSPTGIFGTNPITPSATALELIVPDGGNVYGSIHTHPIFPNAIPMFSWGDVHSLFKTYDNCSPHNSNNVTIILVVKTSDDLGNPINTTYALTIDNPILFLSKMDAELAAMTGTPAEKIREKNDELKTRYENVGIGSENWEKGFLNYFKDYNISLMKANANLTSWNQLTVPNLKLPYNQQIVQPNPCN